MRQDVCHESEDCGKTDRQAHAMCEAEQDKQGVISTERIVQADVEQGGGHHQDAAESVAALASDAVDHAGNPGSAECRRHGEYAHDDTDITLAAALLHDIKRQQEKRAEAGCVAEVCQRHGPECRCVEHRILTVRNWIRGYSVL